MSKPLSQEFEHLVNLATMAYSRIGFPDESQTWSLYNFYQEKFWGDFKIEKPYWAQLGPHRYADAYADARIIADTVSNIPVNERLRVFADKYVESFNLRYKTNYNQITINEDLLKSASPKPIAPISPGFFIQLMTHPATKIAAALLLIAGLVTLSAVTGGLLGLSASTTLKLASGVVATGVGAALLASGFYAAKKETKNQSVATENNEAGFFAVKKETKDQSVVTELMESQEEPPFSTPCSYIA